MQCTQTFRVCLCLGAFPGAPTDRLQRYVHTWSESNPGRPMQQSPWGECGRRRRLMRIRSIRWSVFRGGHILVHAPK